MIDGVFYIEQLVDYPAILFARLNGMIDWDTSMQARKTASYGVAYNYSQMSYPFQEMLPEIRAIQSLLESKIGFLPNNCLVNFYENGQAKMGYHADRIDNLEENTGIAIVSLGSERILRFRKIENKEERFDFNLANGSMVYMTQAVQKKWQHAVPKADVLSPRISLTFRKVKI